MYFKAFITSPVAVILNRTAFVFYAAIFMYGFWMNHQTASVFGAASMLVMIFFSLMGIFYSFIRVWYARWIMAMLAILIPAPVFAGMCFFEWSRPQGWVDWSFSIFFAFFLWIAPPIALALSLFKSDFGRASRFRMRPQNSD